MKFKIKWPLVQIIILVVFSVVAAISIVAAVGENRTLLSIYFLNIGEGDATLIETKFGTQILIDGGPDAETLRALGEVMPWYDSSLDVVIATHPDKDHIGGLQDVLKRYSVDMMMVSGHPSTTTTALSFSSIVSEGNKNGSIGSVLEGRAGMKIIVDDETFIKILFPDREPSYLWDTNTASIILTLEHEPLNTHQSTRVMFTGDAPKMIERFLVAAFGEGLRATLLKLGHHGSKTSSDTKFLEAVKPKITIVSAELNGRYGFPHAEVVERVKAVGADLFHTGRDGTIRCDILTSGSVSCRPL